LQTGELTAAGLTAAELDALELLTCPHPLCDVVPLDRAHAIAMTPGMAGDVARAVACAALTDRVRDGDLRPDGSTAVQVLNRVNDGNGT
jgi:hypothetical protein